MKKAKVENVQTINRDDPVPQIKHVETVEKLTKYERDRNAQGASDMPELPRPDTGGIVSVPKVQPKERKHAKISPSKLKDLEICPSRMEDPNAPEHPITTQGKRCHDALDKNTWKNLTDPEDRRLCEEAAKFTESVVRKYRKNLGEDPLVLSEIKLTLPSGMWGFADRIIIPRSRKGCADLIDYKFATQLQEDAETNPQAQAYALGIFKMYPEIDQVFVTFFYPRLGRLSQAVYNRSDTIAIELRIKTVTDRVKRGGIFLPHPDVCTYCVLQGTCEANLKKILPVAKRYDEGHDMVLPAVPDFSLVKDPAKWSVLLAYAPVLEATAKSIKQHATQFHIETGQDVPGFELVEREGRDKILSPYLAWEICEKYGLTLKDFLGAVEVAVGRLTAAAADGAPKGDKGKTKQELLNKLSDSGVLEQGQPSKFMRKVKAE